MLIIPVIDLCAGNVVHAQGGQRDSYKNIQTPLCQGSNPLAIVKAILSLYPFTKIYIADLDAIKGQGNNNKIIDELLQHHPDVCFWLDAGKHTYPMAFPGSRLRHIVASETGISRQQLLNNHAASNTILSLDFFDNKFIGDKSVLKNTDVWPEDIIIMSLNRVGSHQGPDTSLLAQMQALAINRRIYVAGGVRDEGDLRSLSIQNVSGVLIATALHEGKISAQTLDEYSTI